MPAGLELFSSAYGLRFSEEASNPFIHHFINTGMTGEKLYGLHILCFLPQLSAVSVPGTALTVSEPVAYEAVLQALKLAEEKSKLPAAAATVGPNRNSPSQNDSALATAAPAAAADGSTGPGAC